MATTERPLALVTGASSGIGYELARECARNGFDLIVAADTPLEQAVSELRSLGAQVSAIEADLATPEGLQRLTQSMSERRIDALIANAGHGLGGAFLDQKFSDAAHVVNTNITGTLYLIQKVGVPMRDRGSGRILIVGSIAGFTPGTYAAVYNGTKAFIDSFSWALRAELKDTGVSVTCLMPGATETEFFKRAGMMDTKVGTEEKMDAAEVARIGFKAMMDEDGDVVAGWKNRVTAAVASITPAERLAEQHRKKAQPGTAQQ